MARRSNAGVVGACAIAVGLGIGPSSLTSAAQQSGQTSTRAAAPVVAPAAASAPAVPAAQPATVATPSDMPRLRIGTTAVEIDVVVTDKDGRRIKDLRPEEIELYQDGRKQQLRSLRYITLDSSSSTVRRTGGAPADADSGDVRRTVAIVVDDLNMSFGSMFYTRQALHTLVDREIGPGDQVAVILGDYDGERTEFFTDDKQALRRTIDGLKYNLMSTAHRAFPQMGAGQDQISAFDLQKEAFTVGTLGSLNAIVRAMRDLPGRKAVVLASDGFPLFHPMGGSGARFESTRALEAIRRLVDDANRSFVVMYAVDTRRLAAPPGEIAAGATSFDLQSVYSNTSFYGPSSGPEFLSRAGGGFYLHNSNDLASLFGKVMDDQRGYYLVGYEPDDQTFQQDKRRRPAFHNVKVKVTRPDVRVRSRSGFFGISDEELQRQRSSQGHDEPAAPPTSLSRRQ